MIPSPENTDLIKMRMKIFRYDVVCTKWGWTHDVYFDRKADTYIVADFPTDGAHHLMRNVSFDLTEIETPTRKFKVKVFE